jgi:hypothetical protein
MNAPAIVLCAALALGGCSSAPASAPKPATQLVCAPFRAWSGADLKALADALAPVPENSIVMRMALDWRRYYGDAKSCGGAQNRLAWPSHPVDNER